MRIHLINPSDESFGIGVITPRWLYVLAEATPRRFGDPVITDETLEPLDPREIASGDIVGIGIHTGNALRGYEIGRLARAAGRDGHFRGYSRHSLSRGSASSSAGRTRSSKATATLSGASRSRRRWRDARSRSTTAAVSSRRIC